MSGLAGAFAGDLGKTRRAAVAAAGRHAAKRIAEAVLPASVVVWRGPEARPSRNLHAGRRLALTFDDGPTELTHGYLDSLARFGARATFFVVGEFCARHHDLVHAISDAGHQLAGHGYTHRRFPSLSGAELEDELRRTAALLPKDPTGHPLVRPPHGAVSVSSLITCARAGFTTALWSYDSGDSRTDRPEAVLAAFDDNQASKPGAVVLLHEGQTWTMDALPEILGKFQKAGHELVTMGELLHG